MATGAVDAAIFSVLSNDATLSSLAPGGVYRDIAPQNVSQPFVIVQQMDHDDNYQLGKTRSYERLSYMVKAVARSNSASGVTAAAERIETLLQNATLSVSGYALMLIERSERIKYVEISADNLDIRYQHCGGLYEVMVDPT